jgi:ATP-dependent Clp protease protease subunit
MAKKQVRGGFIEPKIGPSGDYDAWLRWREVFNNIIRVDSEIYGEFTSKVLMEIEQVRRNSPDSVSVIINSPGGEIYGSFAIYESIRRLSDNGIKVITIVEGWAASAAAQIILQAGDTRVSGKLTRFLLHEASYITWFADNKASELRDEAKELELVNDMIIKLMADRCGKSFEDVKKLTERRELWMSAEEALKFGLIDTIV